jgi:phospholipid/cholesterol/gamma-HCH transport system substrate-binding protein
LEAVALLWSHHKQLLPRINAVMTPEAIVDFHEILNNLRVITSNFVDLKVDPEIFNRTMQSIEQASSDVLLAADAVDVAAKDFDVLIETDVRTVLDRSKISMEKLDKTLVRYRGAIKRFKSIDNGWP